MPGPEIRRFEFRGPPGDFDDGTRFAGIEFATLSERLGSYFGVKSGRAGGSRRQQRCLQAAGWRRDPGHRRPHAEQRAACRPDPAFLLAGRETRASACSATARPRTWRSRLPPAAGDGLTLDARGRATMRAPMRRADFHFELPPELIAQAPLPAAIGQPAAVPRWRQRPLSRPALHRPAFAAAAGRPAGVQRHARGGRAAVRHQATRAGASRSSSSEPWASAARWVQAACQQGHPRRPASSIPRAA